MSENCRECGTTYKHPIACPHYGKGETAGQRETAAETSTTVDEMRRLAEKLGGGWRIEHGVMPLVLLTMIEAQRVENELTELRKLRDVLEEVGKWLSSGAFTGWENVLAEIKKAMPSDVAAT